MNVLQEQQEREMKVIDICVEILKNSRNELYLSMRFFDVALNILAFTPDYEIQGVGTEGTNFFFRPDALIEKYRSGRVYVNHIYLHMILHCLFGHMFWKKDKEKECWDLACDITVEYLIDSLYYKCVYLSKTSVRRACYQQIQSELKVVTAQGVYRWLCKMQPQQQQFDQLKAAFFMDDHSRWEEKSSKNQQEQQNRWDDIRDKMQTEMETFSKEASEDSRRLLEQVQTENRKRYDYKEFLRKFAVLKEEMQVDLDTFDYIFYNYGMELYGNMPLIEPQETKEVQKIEDFVIVIDTSMSCKGELVKHFLEETYSVFRQSESFFRKLNIHIIQCDERVQEDQLITSLEDLEIYLKNFTVYGQGGTDFRPAFAYVEELLAKRALGRLRGLVYFTDGYGTFPAKMPPYETAFVFMKDDYRDVDVPPWAIN